MGPFIGQKAKWVNDNSVLRDVIKGNWWSDALPSSSAATKAAAKKVRDLVKKAAQAVFRGKVPWWWMVVNM